MDHYFMFVKSTIHFCHVVIFTHGFFCINMYIVHSWNLIVVNKQRKKGTSYDKNL